MGNVCKKGFSAGRKKKTWKQKKDSLGRDMFVGWNKNLLIIINVMSVPSDYNQLDRSSSGSLDKPMEDLSGLSAEMDNSFNVAKDNSIVGNPHFALLESEGHDISFWLNYGQLM